MTAFFDGMSQGVPSDAEAVPLAPVFHMKGSD